MTARSARSRRAAGNRRGRSRRQDDGVEGPSSSSPCQRGGVGTEPSEGCHHVVLAVGAGKHHDPTRAPSGVRGELEMALFDDRWRAGGRRARSDGRAASSSSASTSNANERPARTLRRRRNRGRGALARWWRLQGPRSRRSVTSTLANLMGGTVPVRQPLRVTAHRRRCSAATWRHHLGGRLGGGGRRSQGCAASSRAAAACRRRGVFRHDLTGGTGATSRGDQLVADSELAVDEAELELGVARMNRPGGTSPPQARRA